MEGFHSMRTRLVIGLVTFVLGLIVRLGGQPFGGFIMLLGLVMLAAVGWRWARDADRQDRRTP